MDNPDTNQQPFQHEPLSQPAAHIRLLKLFPFQDEFAPISGELVEVSRSQLPQYVALSYVWGSTPMVTIYLHGKPVNIQQNLYAFLWHYLRTGRSDLLWTDDLCINQTDPVEKGLQVESMGETYRGASAVVIWLGPPEQTISGFIAAAANVPVGEDASFANRGQHHADAFIQLLENPYWTRVWIVQEFILAQELFVQYGSTWLTWDDFLVYFLSDSVAGVTRATRTRRKKLHSINELIQRRSLWHDPASDKDVRTLLDLVVLNCSRKCKDPRDRVYSILALSGGQMPGSIAITADYTITAVELFFRVMEALNAEVLKHPIYPRDKLLEALELDESSICDSLPDCSPAACLRGHTVSCDGLIFIRATGMLDLPSRPQVLEATEGSVRQWFRYSHYGAGILSPMDPVVSGAGGYRDVCSFHSLADFGDLGFVRTCDPDEPVTSLACAEKPSQQSNLENLDAIATEAFLWGHERGFGCLARGWVQTASPTERRLINEFLKRITEPGIFDLKGITVVKKPSSWDGDFVLALSRQKYASLASKCVEIERDWSYVYLKLLEEEKRPRPRP